MLIGISLGPGDPELMTFKAAKLLQSCIKVFVPGEMAAELARPYCSPEILDFPMIEDKQSLEICWTKNADIVASFASEGTTGFAVLGDVNTFSTFTHLKKMLKAKYPTIEVTTTPGVSVVAALASCFGIALDSSFEISDGSAVDIKIRMKATHPSKLANDLKRDGFEEFILGTQLYTSQERIIRGKAQDMPANSDYFSILYARRKT